MIEPVFEKINFNQRVGDVFEQIKVNCKTEISALDVNGVLSVLPFASVEVLDVETGKIKYGGKVTFYIAYVNADGEIRKCECGSEFSGEIKDACVKDSCRVNAVALVEKTEAETTGAHLAVGAYLTIKAEIIDCEERSALVGGEELVVKESEITASRSFGVKKAPYPVEEEFEVDYAVEEVISHRQSAVVTAVQAGVGCIIVDGEVLFSAIMLQKNGKNDIIRENRVFPFRVEIECEESMPNMQATARVKEKSYKIDVAVDDDGGKSVVTASANLLFEGEVFSNVGVIVACDAFSTEKEVELVKETCAFYYPLEVRVYNAVVSGRSQTNELPVGATVLAVCGERASVLSCECVDGGLAITGILCATALLKDGDGKVFARKLETPFEKVFDGNFKKGTIVDKVVRAERAKAKIISLNEIDLEAEIFLNVYPQEKCDYRLVKELKVLGDKKKNPCAVSVYLAMEGEELWSLAKRLNACPDSLIATNKELQFPLTGKERIVIYRKK